MVQKVSINMPKVEIFDRSHICQEVLIIAISGKSLERGPRIYIPNIAAPLNNKLICFSAVSFSKGAPVNNLVYPRQFAYYEGSQALLNLFEL